MMSVTGSNIQPHYIVLPVVNWGQEKDSKTKILLKNKSCKKNASDFSRKVFYD